MAYTIASYKDTFADAFRDRYPADALWDIVNLMARLRDDGIVKVRRQEAFASMNLCTYHTHEEGVTCAQEK